MMRVCGCVGVMVCVYSLVAYYWLCLQESFTTFVSTPKFSYVASGSEGDSAIKTDVADGHMVSESFDDNLFLYIAALLGFVNYN